MFGNLRFGMKELRQLGLFGKTPFWQNARMVFAEIPVDPEKVKDWLPFPLKLATPARATIFIADYPKTTFSDPYREAAILLHVKLFRVMPAVFCPWMVVDDDRAMILGREMLGYPKKMAEFRFEEKAGKFLGTVTRKGHEIFRIEGSIGDALDAPKPGIGQRAINTRSVMGFMPSHLLMFYPQETVHSANRMNLNVTLTSSDIDPIGIATGPGEEGSIRTCDITGGMAPPPVRIWPVGSMYQARQIPLRVY